MIRAFEQRDLAPTMALRLAVRENVLSDPSKVTEAMVREAVTEHGRGWVWEEDGAVHGFSIAIRDPEHGGPRIWALFVAPGAEGCGIGRALLQRAVDWLREHGAAEIVLSTDPGTRAETLYRRFGFRESARLPNGEVEMRLAAG